MFAPFKTSVNEIGFNAEPFEPEFDPDEVPHISEVADDEGV
jgi:hypothetical protein